MNNKKILALPLAITIISVMFFTYPANASGPLDLAGIDNFAILANTYTNYDSETILDGNLGYTVAPANPPTITGTTFASPNPAYLLAMAKQSSLLSVVNDPGQSGACTVTFGTAIVLDDIPQPLSPGVYCIGGAASISNGLTLSGNGVYIFRINGALDTAVSSAVALAGGANANNVFWAPAGATTLADDSIFAGTILTSAATTLANTVIMNGRILSNGIVTTTGLDVIISTITTPVGVSSTFLTKTASATSVFVGQSVTFTYNETNDGSRPLTNISVTDNQCSPVTAVLLDGFNIGDVDQNNVLDPEESWTFECTQTFPTAGIFTNAAIGSGIDSLGQFITYPADLQERADATVTVIEQLFCGLPLSSYGTNVFIGGPSSDVLIGTQGMDLIQGLGGDDSIQGRGGNDCIIDEIGNNTINGGNGDDTIIGGSGNDIMLGGNGDDTIIGGSGNDMINGNAGNDLINGGLGNDVINGNAGTDTLNGDLGDDVINGQSGNDMINGNDGNDSIDGGAGVDAIYGGSGNDVLIGNAQNDSIYGNDGDDHMFGNAGLDTLNGGAGSDYCNGGAGNDTSLTCESLVLIP